ncbi:hypothetical protein [Nonomuraea sp. NPDC002799]
MHRGDFTKAAGYIIAERDELRKDVRWILDSIAALGDFAGTDETANTFRQSYSTALEKAKTYVDALRDKYPEIAGQLAGMKTNHDRANWANIVSLPTVSDEFSKPDGKSQP